MNIMLECPHYKLNKTEIIHFNTSAIPNVDKLGTDRQMIHLLYSKTVCCANNTLIY